jgi:flagellar motor switch protein FliM
MGPAVLSQAEIDALLGALAQEGGTPSLGAAPGEAGAAPGAASGGPAGDDGATVSVVGRPSGRRPKGVVVKTYDFRRPAKFSKDQLRTLQAIHENVARIAGARLSARLRANVTLTVSETLQMVYDEFVAGLTLPTELVVVAAAGLGGPFLVDLDLGFAMAAVDRLLGGPGRLPTERREPTSIESALISRLVAELVPAIAEGWSHLETLELRVAETALGPALLRVSAPSDVVAVVTFEVRFGGQTAPIAVCYPHDALAPILPRLSATAWYGQRDRRDGQGGFAAELEDRLQRVEVPLAVVLGEVELSMAQLVALAPGDVIRLPERASAPVRISVMNQAHAWGQLGRRGERFAVRLLTPLEPVEE